MGVGPGIKPEASLNGFIGWGASALPSEISVDVWRKGLEYRSWSCHRPHRFYNSTCVSGGVTVGSNTKILDNSQTLLRFLPFPLYSLQGCDSADLNTREYTEMAKAALVAGQSGEFAQEITVSTYSGNPSFQSSATPINTTTTYSTLTPAIDGLIKARSQNANVAGKSVLHIPIHLAGKLANENLVDPRLDGNYLKGTDMRISLDLYPSFTPDLDTAGAANGGEEPLDTETYITITGPVEYGVSTVEIREASGVVQSLQNRTTSLVEQFGIFRFDSCGVYTALVAE